MERIQKLMNVCKFHENTIQFLNFTFIPCWFHEKKKIIFWIWIFFHVEIKDEVIQNEPKENNFKVRRGAKQYPCEKCETIFPSLRRLNQHIAKIHESKKNCHVCHICQMRFSKRGTMESHMSKSHAVIGNRKVEVEEPENNNCDQCKYNTIFIF